MAGLEASVSSSELGPLKKKRNLTGMPDPNAEVIALSPKTLLATNRFICEICKKGFQREQNLQLHRRGHNLPWKLRQRTSNEIRKRVYVCPEPSCVHHDPARALGDLTGIKKHFCRKHCEKKWKCERCSKTYAVKSDWKAHMKICGTREYKCDCGTVFSRRDSFYTHRAFCDALAMESARAEASTSTPPPPPPKPITPPPTTSVASPGLSIQSSDMPETPIGRLSTPAKTISASNGNVLTNMFASNAQPSLSLSSPLCLSNHGSSIFTQPAAPMSATALLQKAAQMGASASSPSLFCGLGRFAVSSSTPSFGQYPNVKSESNYMTTSIGLGLPLTSSSSLFRNKPTTLDLLGLGMGDGGTSSSSGISALFTSFGGVFNVEPAASTSYGARVSSNEETWDGAPDRKPNGSALL